MLQCMIRAGVLVGLTSSMLACTDSTGFQIRPDLVTDTVEVAAPGPRSERLPTALDITGDGAGGVHGGRFPELIQDAEKWDFAVRVENGNLLLVPARAIGLSASRAALTRPIEDETFESLREAPGQGSFTMDSSVVMLPAKVYVARSRVFSGFYGESCVQYAKLEPLLVDVQQERLRLQIVTNQRCNDPRLVPLD